MTLTVHRRSLSLFSMYWDKSVRAADPDNSHYLTRGTDAEHGVGKHVTLIDPSGINFYLHSLYFDGWIYNCALLFIKLSVLCFYQRVFATTRRTRQVLWLTAGITIAWFIGNTFAVLFQCIPARAIWDANVRGKCIHSFAFYLGSAGPSIVLDFVLLFIPVPFLWRLHMRTSQKIALTVTFLLGYL